MAAIADISVTKADNTTAIVWSGIAGSGGDSSPAVWKSNTAPGTAGQRPVLTMTVKSNKAGDVRRADVSLTFPEVYTETTTSLTKVNSKANFQLSFALPQSMAQATINEAVSQGLKLLASSLVVSSIQAGFAPT
jgi:hypothetical protein